MHVYYRDILNRISASPLWFDEHAVPRYDLFSPTLCDIYANEAALVLIICQGCHNPFFVAFSKDRYSPLSLRDRIKNGSLHYGDPPNIGCCPSGPTMNCEDIKVVAYYQQENHKWKRDSSLEIALEDFDIFRGEIPQAPINPHYGKRQDNAERFQGRQ